MRASVALVLATSLFASSAFADTSSLSAGKPAGVREATLAGNGALIFFGLAIVGGGIALVVSQGSSGGKITTTTTGTSP